MSKEKIRKNYQNIGSSYIDEILSLNQECPNPIYFLRKSNVLGNGLSYVLDKLDAMVMAFGWMRGYREFYVILGEDFESELENRPFHYGKVKSTLELLGEEELRDRPELTLSMCKRRTELEMDMEYELAHRPDISNLEPISK